MMQVSIPAAASSGGSLGQVRQTVTVAGRRRTDLYCTRVSQASDQAGTAELVLTPSGQYGADVVRENDLVEIALGGHGLLFRGFVTALSSQASDQDQSVTYTAIDISEKLNDCFFTEDYGMADDVTGAIVRDWSAAQIAARAASLDTEWRALTSSTDYAVAIALETFPTGPAGEQALKGQPLLAGLRQLVQSLDYRARIGVLHLAEATVVYCYLLGEGPRKQLVRGEDPARAPEDQPAGPANVGGIGMQVATAETISHVLAEGAPRLIETSLTPVPDWRPVADDFTPPEGEVLADYVTQTEADAVINHWERYTVERISSKNKTGETFAPNPNYRKKYEAVYTRWRVPAVNDVWQAWDDPEGALLGQVGRYVPLAGECVQTFDGAPVQPFLVLQRQGETGSIVQFGGFTIRDQQWIETDRPLVDTVSRIQAQGDAGAAVADSWDDVAVTSQYEINDAEIDLTDFSDLELTGLWLYLGDVGAPYKVLAVEDAQTLTVYGNLTGASADTRGAEWYLLDLDPAVVGGGSGAGAADGRYQFATPTAYELTNDYAGMMLVLGAFDFGTLAFTAAPADLVAYRITSNTASHLTLEDGTIDLSEASTEWTIVDPRRETMRPYAAIYLNAAYASLRRLAWRSSDLAATKAKRIVLKSNENFVWKTMQGYWALTKSETEGEEDRFTATFVAPTVDVVKQDTALAAWALGTVQGANQAHRRYTVTLPYMAPGLRVGDQVVDNLLDSGATVVAVEHDLETFDTMIAAESVQAGGEKRRGTTEGDEDTEKRRGRGSCGRWIYSGGRDRAADA